MPSCRSTRRCGCGRCRNWRAIARRSKACGSAARASIPVPASPAPRDSTVRKRSFAAEAPLIALLIAGCSAAGAVERLPAYGADSATFTVSGVSAGGYMAVQMHVAHSSRITGVGALAAGPYYCAQGSISTAVNNCMTPGAWSPLPSAAVVKGHVERFAMEKRIDPPGYLARGRAWLFSGTQDSTVKPEVVDALARLYGAFN